MASRSIDEDVDELRELAEDLQERVDELEEENTDLKGRLAGAAGMARSNTERLAELQGRELEKGAHLLEENLLHDVYLVDADLQVVRGTDGARYLRIPDAVDPIDRSGVTPIAAEDLLPIQQLARMDDEELVSAASTRPDQLAARVWRERGAWSPSTVWSRGSGPVREYVDSSDLSAWIRAEEDDVGADYAKKLASRTMDAIVELSSNRTYVEQRTQRKNGLPFKERRLVLPSDAEIPGETGSTIADDPRGQMSSSEESVDSVDGGGETTG